MEFHKLESDDVNERNIRLDPFQTFLKINFLNILNFINILRDSRIFF